MWEGAGDRTELQYIDLHSYGRQRCVFLVLQGGSTGGPEAHSAGWWLSLLHLISNFSGPQLNRGPRAPSAWRGFPYHVSSITPSPTAWLLSWLSYIIVQRPLNLWNDMFDRHQAEITVMQFTGHSLPVHHSEVGPSPCPILSAELTCAISSHNWHWNVSLPSGASLSMAFLAGSKVKIQQCGLFGSRKIVASYMGEITNASVARRVDPIIQSSQENKYRALVKKLIQKELNDWPKF